MFLIQLLIRSWIPEEWNRKKSVVLNLPQLLRRRYLTSCVPVEHALPVTKSPDIGSLRLWQKPNRSKISNCVLSKAQYVITICWGFTTKLFLTKLTASLVLEHTGHNGHKQSGLEESEYHYLNILSLLRTPCIAFSIKWLIWLVSYRYFFLKLFCRFPKNVIFWISSLYSYHIASHSWAKISPKILNCSFRFSTTSSTPSVFGQPTI